MTKATWGEKGLFGLHFHITIYHQRNQARLEQGRNLEVGADAEALGGGGVLLTGLHLVACSACFLIEPRTICPGMAPSKIREALPHHSLIKKLSYKLTCSLILRRHFLS